MRALAGPAMLLVIVGGFMIYRSASKQDAPSRAFTELELAGPESASLGSCYSLSTVLIANGVFGNALRTWTAAGKDKWTLGLENVQQGYGGPVHVFRKFTFEKSADQVKLRSVDASKDASTDIDKNIDELLLAPNMRKSTPVDRCQKDGAAGYRFREK